MNSGTYNLWRESNSFVLSCDIQTVKRVLQFIDGVRRDAIPAGDDYLRGQSPDLIVWQSAVQHRYSRMLVLSLPMELINPPSSLRKAVSPETVASPGAWVRTATGCMPEITNLQDLLHVCKVQGRIKALL